MHPERMTQFLVANLRVVEERMGFEMDAHPDEHAAHGKLERVHGRCVHETPSSIRTAPAARSFGFYKLGALVKDPTHALHPSLIVAPKPFQPANPAVRLPAVVLLAATPSFVALGTDDQLRDHRLYETGRLLGTAFRNAEKALAEGGLRGYPPQAAARGDGFGEGVQTDDTALDIDGEVRGHEGVKEGVARGFLRAAQGGGIVSGGGEALGVGGRVLEVPVGVIFDYDDVVFHAESVDGFSAGQAEDARCGVLADSGAL